MTSKRIPLRMCIVCRKMLPKEKLIRLVSDKETFEVTVNANSKVSGRSAYICKDISCIEKCVKKKVLNKAFSMPVSDAVYTELSACGEKNEE